MPINRNDYQPLVQSVEDIVEEEDVVPQQAEPTTPTTPRSRGKRPQIDLKTIDNAFKKWTESIAQKVKRKKKGNSIEKMGIAHSVFGPEIPAPANYSWPIKTLNHKAPMIHEEYEEMTDAVRDAISQGIHPKMISKGSSGSYFARAKVDGRVQTVGVFKPKDEEPYGRLNPKTTKWLHRQFRWIIPFGRACLIPNLSYISEAAASLLDERLQLYIVPRTELVTFSSPAFFYDWLDRNAAKKGKPLPGKVGSMQCFLQGYQDASEFLRAHPLPGRSISDTFDDSTHRTGGTTKRFLSAMQVLCGRTGDEDLDEEDDDDERIYSRDPSTDHGPDRFHWTKHLQNEFREELEKLVILDFLMRNTDRGSDNYMLKCCERTHERALIDVEPSRSSVNLMPVMREANATETITPSGSGTSTSVTTWVESTKPEHDSSTYTRAPHLHLAAIDNSLAFPHEHPKGWRSFTYGWLYLPVSVIGRPFSEKTRNHFLPILTSKAWWEETTYQLKKLFAVDPDFHPKMFKRQLAVMKGQAWNIVQCLKHADEGPLELTRRQKLLVWDDEVEIPVDTPSPSDPLLSPTMSPPVRLSEDRRRSISERRVRSRSFGSFPFPPPMRRSTTEGEAGARPVPFAGKFQKINPGASGVRVLEHMERYDEVERGLKKLGMEESMIVEEEEERDIGVKAKPAESSQTETQQAGNNNDLLDEDDVGEAEDQHLEVLAASTISAPMLSGYSSDEETEAGDLSASLHESSRRDTQSLMGHARATSDDGGRRSFDWARMRRRRQTPPAGKTRTVIVERLETVDAKPFFQCW